MRAAGCDKRCCFSHILRCQISNKTCLVWENVWFSLISVNFEGMWSWSEQTTAFHPSIWDERQDWHLIWENSDKVQCDQSELALPFSAEQPIRTQYHRWKPIGKLGYFVTKRCKISLSLNQNTGLELNWKELWGNIVSCSHVNNKGLCWRIIKLNLEMLWQLIRGTGNAFWKRIK